MMFINKARGTLAQRHMLTAFPGFNKGYPPDTYKVVPVEDGSAVYFSKRARVVFFHDGRVKAEIVKGPSMEWAYNLDILRIRAEGWKKQLRDAERENLKSLGLLG
tara:strand:- start:815 stop:1129 length:315 start_codon:yes stop_codon:yes gene_type:complete